MNYLTSECDMNDKKRLCIMHDELVFFIEIVVVMFDRKSKTYKFFLDHCLKSIIYDLIYFHLHWTIPQLSFEILHKL